MAGAIEIDRVAVETYASNHRSTAVWENDIRRVSSAEVLARLGLERGELDLLAGCPPCQGFSTLRTRRKMLAAPDARNDLIGEFARFARDLWPRAVMMENVPGLQQDRRFQHLCSDLEAFGYALTSRVVDAADYGVPQRRHRLILVGLRGGLQAPSIDTPRRSRRHTVRDAIACLDAPGGTGDALHDAPERRSRRVRRLIRQIPADGGSRAEADGAMRLACHLRCDGFTDVYGRMAWDDVAPTITSGCINPSKGRFLHPEQHRAITLREAALLQSFPREYVFSLTRGKEHAALMIGNALPPRLIEHLAKGLLRQMARPA